MSAGVGALLLGGLAQSLELFGEHVEQVRVESDKGPDEALALMADLARRAWLVEQPGEHELRVLDADGGATLFELDDGALRVTRPSGVSGALLDGVSAFSIATESVRRLREAEPVSEYRAWWQREIPFELLGSVTVESGLPLALGFRMDSDVPDEFDVVADVEEHAESALLETLVLPLTYLAAMPADPNEPMVGDDESPGKSKSKKVEICHVPPGNPGNAHTLSVSENAVDAHLAHGDWLGSCEASPGGTSNATLRIELYEARAPDDARPFGDVLGTVVIGTGSLPTGHATWVATQVGDGGELSGDPDQDDATTPDGKVVMCHVPPGNPGNSHAISISPNAVPAHLAHGDYFGCCGDHDGTNELWVLDIDAPPIEVALDLTSLQALVLPGRAYSLVLSLEGNGFLFLGSVDVPDAAHSGVAQAAQQGGALMPAAMRVPFELRGLQQITQTEERHPVSLVSLGLEMDDGREVHGSSSVFGQVSVPGVWAGVADADEGGDS